MIAHVAKSAFHGCVPISGILDLRPEAPAPDNLEARIEMTAIADLTL
ncbi:MAG: hypothetical protein H5U18_02830 [Rhodobacteraceae bacterium]|nr:hypothetical protein [Paracoccaceae bacterium]